MNFSWLMPETVSTFGPALDNMYYVILWITGIVFFATEITLLVFMVKYRHKEGRKAEYIHGSNKAEVVWTSVTFVIVVALAFYSKGIWDEIRDPDLIPPDAYPIHVMGAQFEWTATYSGADGQFDTSDDFTSLNVLHMAVNQPVVVQLEAEDVIHSFFLPEFRVKQDAVPGMTTPVWFEATRTGEFTLACAELCGLGHYRMGGTVIVHSQADFQNWLAEQQAAAEDD
ncbi:MAG TPA: cytochrome c oxidase subunit II [Gemmatimonadetes bacterium]|nr:cytochrome c oxidase subunit II [Gemmatimonadota bacterium]